MKQTLNTVNLKIETNNIGNFYENLINSTTNFNTNNIFANNIKTTSHTIKTAQSPQLNNIKFKK